MAMICQLHSPMAGTAIIKFDRKPDPTIGQCPARIRLTGDKAGSIQTCQARIAISRALCQGIQASNCSRICQGILVLLGMPLRFTSSPAGHVAQAGFHSFDSEPCFRRSRPLEQGQYVI